MRTILLTTTLITFLFLISLLSPNSNLKVNGVTTNIPTPTPTPASISNYVKPTLPVKEAYTIILVGDSMTQALGPNSDAFRAKLEALYPDTIFGIFNYGFSATNILSVNDRLTKETTFNGTTFPSILGRQFDVIILESFAHNPLSEYPLDQGITLQNQTLDKIVRDIVVTHPEAVIIFQATLGPSKTHYAQGNRDLDPQTRLKWTDERAYYLENHINYAKSHNIPLIDIFHPSLGENGSVNLKYIDSHDYIHPSTLGLELIASISGDFLYDNNIIPKP